MYNLVGNLHPLMGGHSISGIEVNPDVILLPFSLLCNAGVGTGSSCVQDLG
jgi:hypothetical protein